MNIYDLIVDDKEEISLNDVFLDDQNLAQVKRGFRKLMQHYKLLT